MELSTRQKHQRQDRRRYKEILSRLLFDGPIVEQVGLEIQGAQFDLLDRKFEQGRTPAAGWCARR